jgi:hypothetical protein
MRKAIVFTVVLLITLAAARAQAGEFLTPQEVESVRDEQDYGKRVVLYLQFAQRRIDAVRNQMTSKDEDAGDKIQENLSEFNSILQAAGDALDAARERRASLDKALRDMQGYGANFLRYLTTLKESSSPLVADFRFTLDEAIDSTNDELAEVKKGAFPEVQERKPPTDLPSSPPPSRSRTDSGRSGSTPDASKSDAPKSDSPSTAPADGPPRKSRGSRPQ